jgi:hypothetical protein
VPRHSPFLFKIKIKILSPFLSLSLSLSLSLTGEKGVRTQFTGQREIKKKRERKSIDI